MGWEAWDIFTRVESTASSYTSLYIASQDVLFFLMIAFLSGTESDSEL
jgi:hypothetical protein